MTTNQLTLTITHLRVHCCARAFTHPILMILKSSVEGVFSIVNRIQRSEHQCFFLKAQGLHIGLSYATSTVCLVLYVWNEGCGQMQSTVLKVCTVILLKKKGHFLLHSYLNEFYVVPILPNRCLRRSHVTGAFCLYTVMTQDTGSQSPARHLLPGPKSI